MQDNNEIQMIRVGRDQYMTEGEADRKGYREQPEQPIPGAPIFGEGTIDNLIVLGISIFIMYLILPYIQMATKPVASWTVSTIGL
jgi:hypothetical protein